MKKLPTKKGFTLIETIIYILILTLFSVLTVNTVFMFAKSWSAVKVTKNITISSVTALERFTRDVRKAQSVAGSSVLAAYMGPQDLNSPGRLDLNTKDEAGNSVIQSFYVSNGRFVTQVGNGPVEELTLSTVSVQRLSFHKTLLLNAEAVRIEMLLFSSEGDQSITKLFETTVVLRGGYQN